MGLDRLLDFHLQQLDVGGARDHVIDPKSDGFGERFSFCPSFGDARAFLGSDAGATRNMLMAAAKAGGGFHSIPMFYDGSESIMVSPEDAVIVPVKASSPYTAEPQQTMALLASDKAVLDVVPGIWPTGAQEGLAVITNLTEFDLPLEAGDAFR